MCYKDNIIYQVLLDSEHFLLQLLKITLESTIKGRSLYKINPNDLIKEILSDYKPNFVKKLKRILYDKLEYFLIECIEPNELYSKLHIPGKHKDLDKVSALLDVIKKYKELKEKMPDFKLTNKYEYNR